MRRPKVCYLVADGGRARFVRRNDDVRGQFVTVQEVESATLHRQSSDLGTDRPGRTHESAARGSHAVQPREDLHTAEKAVFARTIAAVLNEASKRDEFDELVLIAPARTLSEIRSTLDATCLVRVVAELQKDLTKVPDTGLAHHIAELR